MKPTQEQIIAWARKYGDWNGQTVEMNDVGLEAAYVAAYEANRKDENDACAKLVVQCSWNVKGAENALLVDGCAAAIRARREQ